MVTALVSPGCPVQPRSVSATILAVICLPILLRPEIARCQEAEEPFRFEGIKWNADRESVQKKLRGHGYELLDARGTELSFNGEFLDRSARVRAVFSNHGDLDKVVVTLSEEMEKGAALAFVAGARRGIRFNRGPPCGSTLRDGARILTWQTDTGRGASSLKVRREGGKVTFTYLGPGHEANSGC